MEIQALQVRLTEEDLNEALKRHLPANFPVKDVQLRLPGDTLVMTGVLPLFINVKFETIWELSVQEGRLHARLARFKAMGMSANIFKSAVMKIFADQAKKEAWLSTEGDVVIVDPDGLGLSAGLKVQTNLVAVICRAGELLIEARKLSPP